MNVVDNGAGSITVTQRLPNCVFLLENSEQKRVVWKSLCPKDRFFVLLDVDVKEEPLFLPISVEFQSDFFTMASPIWC